MTPRAAWFALLILTAMLWTPAHVQASQFTLSGYVKDEQGGPLVGARILVRDGIRTHEAATDKDGYYQLAFEPTRDKASIYAVHGDPETGVYSHLPQLKEISTDGERKVNFTLPPAATVVMVGQIKPVETTRTIRLYTVKALDPTTGAQLKAGNLTLIYGSASQAVNSDLGLSPDTLILPIGTPLVLEFRSQTEVPPRTTRFWGFGAPYGQPEKTLSFTIREEEPFTLVDGQVLELDYRKYSLAKDIQEVCVSLNQTGTRLTELEAGGFYVTAERFDLKEASDQLSGAIARHEADEYEACYVDLSSAYIGLAVLNERLGSLITEASISVKALIVFIALTAVVLGGFVTERRGVSLVISAASFALMAAYLYRVYPGSALVSLEEFTAVSIVSISVFASPLLVARFVGGGSGWVSQRIGEWVSMFSFAKRNLRRRKLRFAFTFLPIMLLTMSFVALTSLSSGYGLVSQWVPNAAPDASGILVRMNELIPKTEFEKGQFYTVIQPAVDWVSSYEGVTSAVLKAENTPQVRPMATVDGYELQGVIGLDAQGEPLMPHVDACVVEGTPLREDGTCLVHTSVLLYTRLRLGDTLTVGGVPMTMVGAFDNRIQGVTDMDGETLLPGHQVITNPGDELPRIEVRTVEPYHVVVTTLQTAQRIRGVRASRVIVLLEEGADDVVLGKSMALAREYRVWVSTGGDVLRATMTDTVAGKGIGVSVPWLIVVLNVLATMMGSMYERRAEINILSSVGLNPTHISGVFMGEALITGVTAGGLGYLLGLGWYPAMRALTDAPVVNQKVSAAWVLASIGVAVAAVAAGTLLALRSTTLITPSFTRNWRLTGAASTGDAWTVPLPTKIMVGEAEGFHSYMVEALARYNYREGSPFIYAVKTSKSEDGARDVSFTYRDAPSNIGAKTSYNRLRVEAAGGDGTHRAVLEARGTPEAVEATAVFMRKLMIQWTVDLGQARGPTR